MRRKNLKGERGLDLAECSLGQLLPLRFDSS
jgi:hypothetical protein